MGLAWCRSGGGVGDPCSSAVGGVMSLAIIDLLLDAIALIVVAILVVDARRLRREIAERDSFMRTFEAEREWLREQMVELVEHIDARFG